MEAFVVPLMSTLKERGNLGEMSCQKGSWYTVPRYMRDNRLEDDQVNCALIHERYLVTMGPGILGHDTCEILGQKWNW